MTPNLKQLEAFVRVADLESFRRAAERLNTTQPNISARISALERALDVRLMDRDAGSVRLTPKGRELLVHARIVLKDVEALIDASGNPALNSGALRLGVAEMVVHTWLRDFIRALKEKFPNIVVELIVDLSANLQRALSDRSIDLTLQSGPFTRQTSGDEDLGTFPFVWVASPTLGLHLKENPTKGEMSSHPILTHARDSLPYEEVHSHFSGSRDSGARIVPSSNLATCLHMTIDGMGIATLPAAMVARNLRVGDLITIPYPWVPQSLHFRARYDSVRSPSYVAKIAKLAADTAADFAAKNEL